MHPHSLLALTLAPLAVQAYTYGSAPLGWSGKGSFRVAGSSGVSAMQMIVTEESKVLFINRVENGPLKKNGNPVWASEFDVNTLKVRALSMQSNSFCAGGSFNGKGQVVNVGGDGYTGYGAQSGLQKIRVFTPCTNNKCTMTEPAKMSSPRWYPGSVRKSDGNIMIMGGVSETTYMTQNPTIEFYPSKGSSVYSQFLKDTAPNNLFPHIISLPNYASKVFVATSNKAMIYDWKTNKESRLPDLPNNQIVNYPRGAATILLPLRPATNYAPEVLLCGGTQLAKGQSSDPNTPATTQCSRMVLTSAGIKKGWQIEQMPEKRIMGDWVITPDLKLFLVNGAGNGAAGYYNDYNQQTGSYSSAINPVYTPYLYDPDQRAGTRFVDLGVQSTIARMYHSTASLLADGRIIIAGSNPNPGFTSSGKFPSELRTEFFSPPYLSNARPSFSGAPTTMKFGATYTLKLSIPSGADTSKIVVSVHDLGFATHAVDMSRRAVELVAKLSADKKSLTITAPPSTLIYPRGPAFLFVTVAGVPAKGKKIMIS